MSTSSDTAIVLTIYNRPMKMLSATFSALYHAMREAALTPHLVVVDDGSDERHREKYARLRQKLANHFSLRWVETSTLVERPDTYNIRGYNNQAFAMNCAIHEAMEMSPKRILILSSDIIVGESALRIACSYPNDRIIIGKTSDSMSRRVFCAARAVRPWCWFVLAPAVNVAETLFDEGYLQGMGFEDIDFMARLLLSVGRLVVDDQIVCVHQTHPMVAYSDRRHGHDRSRVYTVKKWGGVPFHGDRSFSFISKLDSKNNRAELTQPRAKTYRKTPTA